MTDTTERHARIVGRSFTYPGGDEVATVVPTTLAGLRPGYVTVEVDGKPRHENLAFVLSEVHGGDADLVVAGEMIGLGSRLSEVARRFAELIAREHDSGTHARVAKLVLRAEALCADAESVAAETEAWVAGQRAPAGR